MKVTPRRIGIAAAFAVCALAASIGLPYDAHAMTWDNRGDNYGYFDNGQPFGTPYGGVYKGLMSAPRYVDSTVTPAIPHSVDTAQKYYDYMYDKYHHSGNPLYAKSYGTYKGTNWDEKDRTGISFMVNALLGRNGDQAHRVPTAADWAELHDRMLQPGIAFILLSRADASSYRGADSYYQLDRNDVGRTATVDDGGLAFALTYNGSVKWVMLYKCGNVLGNWDGLPKILVSKTWAVSTSVSTTQTSVNVGDTITWHHSVSQQGPDETDQTVTYGYRNSGNIAGISDSGTLPAGTVTGTNRPYDSTYVPTIADSGKQVCRQSFANPSATAQGWTLSDVSCVNVNVYYNYQLHPTVALPSGGTRDTLEPGGGSKAVTPKVTLTGITGSKPTTWQLTRCLYQPNAGYPTTTGETASGATAGATFGGACTIPASGTDVYGNGTRQYGDAIESQTDLPAGTHICYILSVNPPGSSTGGWLHSAPACFALLKTPKIHALGGDVRAGTVQTGSVRNLDGRYYGSWAEYGIFGVGGINGMGSGASLAGGGPSNQGTKVNALTFANAGTLGNFYPAPSNSYYDAYAAIATTHVGSLSYGGPVGDGHHEIIQVDGDLTITGDVTYDGDYASANDVPRLIFAVSGNITVLPGVTRIDAWIITAKTLYTCADFTAPAMQKLTTGTCTQPLRFNGPVIADRIVLGRTFGSNGDAGSRDVPAEVFNLSPNNYISGYSASVSSRNIQTIYEKELPPRW